MERNILQPNMVAPEHPTTEALLSRYPLSTPNTNSVELQREAVRRSYLSPGLYTCNAVGGCSVTVNDQYQVIAESKIIKGTNSGQTINAQRINVWKPRTDPDDWHGLETEDAAMAFSLIHQAVTQGGAVAMEIGYLEQLERYGDMLCIAWLGSRSVGNKLLHMKIIEMCSKYNVPIGLKNELSGEADTAIELAETINERRVQIFGEFAYPAFLMYRGGFNYQTPEAILMQIESVIYQTQGRVMIDVAHGLECAFDPEAAFKKSVIGQQAAANAISELALRHSFMGVMAEASDLPSITDPNMPFRVGLELIDAISKSKAKTAIMS